MSTPTLIHKRNAIIVKTINNMIIIIGLGNPGKQYKNTRHNVGFLAIDAFAEKNGFPDFKLQKKTHSLVSEHVVDGKLVLLAKPQTFMNESGKAVKQLVAQKDSELIVIHDDIDLPLGKLKIIKERGSAGHKGVESIIQSVGNDGLVRFRIGIGASTETPKDTKAMEIVLKSFSPEDQKVIDETINKTVDALALYIREGLEKSMNAYNK